MGSHHSDRRQFLTESAALASLAVGAVQWSVPRHLSRCTSQGHAGLRTASRFDDTVRKSLGAGTPITDTALTTPLQDLDGIITPSGLHFLMDHVNGIPDIDPQQHRLLMHGMVDRPLTFTMDELRRFPSVSKIYFLECNANSRPLRGPNGDSVQLVHGRTSCSEWTGVLLSVLLKECGVKSGGELDRGRGLRRQQVHDEPPAGESHRRHAGGLRAEWRACPPAQRLSAATRRPGLGGDSLREVVEPHRRRQSTCDVMARGRQQRRHRDPLARRSASDSRSAPNRSSPVRREASACRAADSTKSPVWRGPELAPSLRSMYPSTVDGPTGQRSFRIQSFGSRTRDFVSRGSGTARKSCCSRAAPMKRAKCSQRSPRRRNLA